MATIAEKLETLHPDVIRNYIATGKPSGITADLVEYIQKIDKVPELFRIHGSPSKTARELCTLYPGLFSSVNIARIVVFAAINHFHLNSTVKNQAWDNLYADRFDELAQIEIQRKNIDSAKRILTEAHRLRTLRNDDSIDPDKIKPVIQVISPQVTPDMLGLDPNFDIGTYWRDVKTFVKNRLKNVDTEQKDAILREASRNLNIEDADFENAE